MSERSLLDLFYRVQKVLPETQKMMTFPAGMPVSEALVRMRKANVSQVPVMSGHEVLGVFSYRSFAQGVTKLPKKELFSLTLPVEEFLEDFKFAQITDNLEKLFDEFDLMDAVLVGLENRLQGIVTTIDALRYFYAIASPYVLLREIELSIRELIRLSVTPSELGECAEKCLKHIYKDSVPKNLEDMTLSDYVAIIGFGSTWEQFKKAFGENRTLVNTRLKPLPDLRNAVFHFKREITIEEYDSLRDVRDWLLKRTRKIEGSGEVRADG